MEIAQQMIENGASVYLHEKLLSDVATLNLSKYFIKFDNGSIYLDEHPFELVKMDKHDPADKKSEAKAVAEEHRGLFLRLIMVICIILLLYLLATSTITTNPILETQKTINAMFSGIDEQ